jgi:hypothetical protein
LDCPLDISLPLWYNSFDRTLTTPHGAGPSIPPACQPAGPPRARRTVCLNPRKNSTSTKRCSQGWRPTLGPRSTSLWDRCPTNGPFSTTSPHRRPAGIRIHDPSITPSPSLGSRARGPRQSAQGAPKTPMPPAPALVDTFPPSS